MSEPVFQQVEGELDVLGQGAARFLWRCAAE
ncbi:hypothetical protein FHR34_007626 [Kitasatospora kifunensis]|uniref:Uncharacterized protein n=1 Tax=Kitasatospora kifunensis TaxID=58351 RepID=A0A7W7W095_KITKI|nr:hypothetical protein [Kitasatospora kifunensis]